MTFAEAIEATRRGQAVTHPRANVGWRLKLEGKSVVWAHATLKHTAPVDKLDQHRKDWEIAK